MLRYAKILVITLALILVAAPLVWAKTSGPSPISENATVTVTVPERVGIDVKDTAITINVGAAPNDGHYPPATFPGYYVPTSPGFNPSVRIDVFCNKAAGWDLSATAAAAAFYAGGPSTTALYVATAGTGQTADSTASPAAPWAAVTTTPNIDGAAAKASWDPHNVDFELRLAGAEDPGSGGRTVTFTVTARP